MKVEVIHLRAPDETEVREVALAEAIAGKGIEGDLSLIHISEPTRH